MNSKPTTQTETAETVKQQPAEPKAGRRRKDARYDLPVIRPSTSRAKLARLLV